LPRLGESRQTLSARRRGDDKDLGAAMGFAFTCLIVFVVFVAAAFGGLGASHEAIGFVDR
jgi:ABC-type uncharacterized transport system permease subunit